MSPRAVAPSGLLLSTFVSEQENAVKDAPTLFFDIGGVLLTNAWDTPARNRAVEAFGLDGHDFHARHGMVKTAFETGRLSLDAYIKRTVFHVNRAFTADDF